LSSFLVGDGDFGGKRNSEHIVPHVDPPKRKPDASLTYKTSIDQVRIHFKCGLKEKKFTEFVLLKIGCLVPPYWRSQSSAHRRFFRRYGRI
jgi:hypothetical protein